MSAKQRCTSGWACAGALPPSAECAYRAPCRVCTSSEPRTSPSQAALVSVEGTSAARCDAASGTARLRARGRCRQVLLQTLRSSRWSRRHCWSILEWEMIDIQVTESTQGRRVQTSIYRIRLVQKAVRDSGSRQTCRNTQKIQAP